MLKVHERRRTEPHMQPPTHNLIYSFTYIALTESMQCAVIPATAPLSNIAIIKLNNNEDRRRNHGHRSSPDVATIHNNPHKADNCGGTPTSHGSS